MKLHCSVFPFRGHQSKPALDVSGGMGNVVVAALIEGGPAQRASDKVRMGDIIR